MITNPASSNHEATSFPNGERSRMMVDIDALTDEQVVSRFLESQFEDEIGVMLQGEKIEFKKSLEDEGVLAREAIDMVSQRYGEFLDDKHLALRNAIQEVALRHHSVEEMRVLLKFREQYPEIHAHAKQITLAESVLVQDAIKGWFEELQKIYEEALEELGEERMFIDHPDASSS